MTCTISAMLSLFKLLAKTTCNGLAFIVAHFPASHANHMTSHMTHRPVVAAAAGEVAGNTG